MDPRKQEGRINVPSVISGLRPIAATSRETGSDNAADAADAVNSATSTHPRLNRYVYENLLNNIEAQVEFWNRLAVRNPNPEAAHALWLKAEGLAYALRLLYAFEPESRELVECASRVATGGTTQP
jgi:hypothetical protein